LTEFQPLFRNGHLATIAANFWKRNLDVAQFPVRSVVYQTEPAVRIRVDVQSPASEDRGDLVLLHGLEGSSNSGYMQSMAQAALLAGFRVHRVNTRTCGGTSTMAPTLYHAGLSSDLHYLLQALKSQGRDNVYLAGYSLGGNVALKFLGEMGTSAGHLLRAAAAISVPLDLAACCRAMEHPRNFIYQRRFVRSLKASWRRRVLEFPDRFAPSEAELAQVQTVWQFDHLFTAPHFGFGTAENYYATQSAQRYLDGIRLPTLLVAAQDDPLVPFAVYRQPAIASNQHLQLLAPIHGGHVGFLARRQPRFWLDETLVKWFGASAGIREPFPLAARID
jgi:uncharacterized protein